MQYEEVLNHVRTGKLTEEQLRAIQTAASARIKKARETASRRKFATLNDGDVVRFNDQASPQYLRGLLAVVSGHRETRVEVRCPAHPAYQRFNGSKNVGCPPNIIDYVDDSTLDEREREMVGLVKLAIEMEGSFNAVA